MTSLEALKSTMQSLKTNILEGNVLKYFKDRKEFAKLVNPLVQRY